MGKTRVNPNLMAQDLEKVCDNLRQTMHENTQLLVTRDFPGTCYQKLYLSGFPRRNMFRKKRGEGGIRTLGTDAITHFTL